MQNLQRRQEDRNIKKKNSGRFKGDPHFAANDAGSDNMGRRPDGSVVTGHYVDDLKGETGQAHGLSQNKIAKIIAVRAIRPVLLSLFVATGGGIASPGVLEFSLREVFWYVNSGR